MDKKWTLEALSALAHETRLDVFRLLVKAGPDGLSAGDISQALGVRQNTMSTHLSILNRAGLLKSARDGRKVLYMADFDGMRGVLAFLMEDCCGGRPEACAPILDEVIKAA